MYHVCMHVRADNRSCRLGPVPQESLTVGEVQVLDSIQYQPSDLRIAPWDEKE